MILPALLAAIASATMGCAVLREAGRIVRERDIPVPIEEREATGTPRPSPTLQIARACDQQTGAETVRPSVVRIQSLRGIGTGIVTDPNGLILTNNHVVETDRIVAVTLADGSVVTAQVVERRATQDLAILGVEAPGLVAVKWGNDRALQPGQRVFALGYARDLPGEPSLTAGLFSARRHGDSFGIQAELLQTDTAVNPGNSGGPLFTACGEVVGIVAGGLAESEGLNFAIAASNASQAAVALVDDPTLDVSATLSPAETVALFYTLIDQRRYEDAYALLSPRFQASNPYGPFHEGYNTTRDIAIEQANEISSSPPVVRVNVIAVDDFGGERVIRRFAGTWTLAKEDGDWKLDVARIELQT